MKLYEVKLEEQKEAKRAAPETRKGVVRLWWQREFLVVLLKMHFSHDWSIKQNDTWASKIKYNVKLLMDFHYVRDGWHRSARINKSSWCTTTLQMNTSVTVWMCAFSSVFIRNMAVPVETSPTADSLMESDSSLRDVAELLSDAEDTVDRTQGLNLKSLTMLQQLEVILKHIWQFPVIYAWYKHYIVLLVVSLLFVSSSSIFALSCREKTVHSILWLKWPKICWRTSQTSF